MQTGNVSRECRWTIELFVSPSSKLSFIIVIVALLLVVLILIIFILYYKEKVFLLFNSAIERG